MTKGLRLRFSQVDVFSREPYRGNPVAVVHGADSLTDDQMAVFARWTNLSETTFLLRPTRAEADYRLRIFTPGGELPFAGHPTLGSCYAWRSGGGESRQREVVVQECAAGLINIRDIEGDLFFAAPPLRRTGPLDDALVTRLQSALGLSADAIRGHQWVDNGPGWCALLLNSASQVLDVSPDFAALGDAAVGLVGPHDPDESADFEVRAFVPDMGVPEDPVTGSLNAGIAQWLIGAGLAPERYAASQGTVMGRAGTVMIRLEGEDIWVGGNAVECLSGEARF